MAVGVGGSAVALGSGVGGSTVGVSATGGCVGACGALDVTSTMTVCTTTVTLLLSLRLTFGMLILHAMVTINMNTTNNGISHLLACYFQTSCTCLSFVY